MKKIAAFLVAAVMIIGLVPAMAFPAFAAESVTVSNWSELVSAVKNSSYSEITLGGDIDATSSASLQVNHKVTVDGAGHTINGNGRGLFVTKGGMLTLKNTIITNATRTDKKKGCVVYAYSGGGANLENCIIYNCKDSYSSSSGVIYCSSYPLNMTNCTVIDNKNGIEVGSGSITGSIIAGNEGTDVKFKSSSSSVTDGGYNLIGTASSKPSAFSAETTVIDSGLSSYSAWLTGEGDLIKTDSNPAIDKIPSGFSVPVTDIYGTNRPVGNASDIGAVEYFEEGNVASIAITTPPSTTSYVEGQTFDKSGMVVTANYEDSSSRVIRTYTYEPAGELSKTDTAITVSYGGQTAEQPITVGDKTAIDSAASLKAAINGAKTGDILILDDDITLDSGWGNENTLLGISGKSLTIDGKGHTIDGAGKYAFLKITGSSSSTVTLTMKNLIVAGMVKSDSSASVVETSGKNYVTINMNNCILRNNSGYHGTVYMYEGCTLNMDHCTVIDNKAPYSSSNYSAIYLNKSNKGGIKHSIIVGNTGYNEAARDLRYSSSTSSFTCSYDVIGDTNLPVSNSKTGEQYSDYSLWMESTGNLYYPPFGAENPAVDLCEDEKSSGTLTTDIYGNDRPQGKASDAGAVETAAADAATPVLRQNLSPDTEEYIIGDTAKELSINASVSDNGELSYEWYYIDLVDTVSSATVKIDGANENSYTPSTSAVGKRVYFVVAYNTNLTDTYINGKNGDMSSAANDDEKRTLSIYAISEHHPINVSVGELVLKEIKITNPPDKTDYIAGQKFDRTGMIVEAVYQNGEEVVSYPVTSYSVDKTTLTAEDTEVTVTFEDKTAAQAITVEPLTPVSIVVTKPPTKTKYNEGELFDSTGMVVTATNNDGTTVAVTDYTVEPAEGLKKTDTSVTISYSGLTAEVPIQVGINNIDQLRDAVSAASAGDTLKLTDNIEMDDQGPVTINKNLTIDGQGKDIDGNGQSAFIQLAGGSLTLKNLRVSGMVNANGGAVVECSGMAADLFLSNCVITGNAGAAGAIRFAPSKGILTMDHVTILHNLSGQSAITRGAKSAAPTGIAGGVNTGKNVNAQISNSIIVGNGMRNYDTAFDLKLEKEQPSGGNNLIGVQSGLTTADTDKIDDKFNSYSSWITDQGVPVQDAVNSPIITLDTAVPDMYGNESSVIGAISMEGAPVEQQGYVLMNIPYADFYKGEEVEGVDAVTSATQKAYKANLVGGSYHAAEDETYESTDILGVMYPVLAEDAAALDADKIITPAEGQTPEEALFAAGDGAYVELAEKPASYKKLSNGEYGAASGRASALELEASISALTKRGDYEIKLSGDNVSAISGGTVYGVILTTESGTYAMRHLENIWKGKELAFCTGHTETIKEGALTPNNDMYEDLEGQTITQIKYFTKDAEGAYKNYTIATSIEVPEYPEAEFTEVPELQIKNLSEEDLDKASVTAEESPTNYFSATIKSSEGEAVVSGLDIGSDGIVELGDTKLKSDTYTIEIIQSKEKNGNMEEAVMATMTAVYEAGEDDSPYTIATEDGTPVKPANEEDIEKIASGEITEFKDADGNTWKVTNVGKPDEDGKVAITVELELADNEYRITVEAGKGGTAATSPSGKAKAGDKVTVTVAPNKGYELTKIEVSYKAPAEEEKPEEEKPEEEKPEENPEENPEGTVNGTNGDEITNPEGTESGANGDEITNPEGTVNGANGDEITNPEGTESGANGDGLMHLEGMEAGAEGEEVVENITEDKFFTMPDAHVTVTVTFRKTSSSGGGGGGGGSSSAAKFTLTYETNGGSEIKAESYSSGAKVSLDKTPAREGYTFTGWYSDKELTKKVTSVQMNSSMTVYAGWEEIPQNGNNENTEDVPLMLITIGDTKYQLNGADMEMDAEPFIDENDRTMLPVRVVANALGISDADIAWDNETKTASFTRPDGKVVSCTVGSNIIKIGDEEIEIDTAPVIRNDRIYLPMRALFNAFNVSDDHIIWDGVNKTVTVTKKALEDIKAIAEESPSEE